MALAQAPIIEEQSEERKDTFTKKEVLSMEVKQTRFPTKDEQLPSEDVVSRWFFWFALWIEQVNFSLDDVVEACFWFSSEKNISLFSYIELKSATDSFHPRNKIGRGGFGTVYKGILRNGVIVAVKVLSADSRQGVREFLTEIDVITNNKHSNLVELIGCCVEGSNRILVYEYLENGSLDRALLGSNSDAVKLNWDIRSAICVGIARGLVYLHEELQPPTWTLLEEDRLTELVDVALKDYPEDQVIRYIKVALFCTQAAAGRRPSMSQVVEMLSRPVQLNSKEITRPGYMEDSGKTSSSVRATNSTFSRLEDSTTGDTTTPFSPTRDTFTEMSPR
ncbi:hypothetical protein BHE74_00035528 [Ensete ventricosum]|nr:hypothetical protein BHE74_00035528 [Ensete ventricosum]